jgi:hypothetical protein
MKPIYFLQELNVKSWESIQKPLGAAYILPDDTLLSHLCKDASFDILKLLEKGESMRRNAFCVCQERSKAVRNWWPHFCDKFSILERIKGRPVYMQKEISVKQDVEERDRCSHVGGTSLDAGPMFHSEVPTLLFLSARPALRLAARLCFQRWNVFVVFVICNCVMAVSFFNFYTNFELN